MNTIKVGVAGLGFIGPAHVEALRRTRESRPRPFPKLLMDWQNLKLNSWGFPITVPISPV